MANLFSPLKLAAVELPNRIIVSPMSQYSAVDGKPTDWHFIHYGSLANSGAALVTVESTHVTAEGRGTPACLGIYTDEQEAGFARIVDAVHEHGSSLIGLQLNHSGRKASSTLPWEPVKGALEPGRGWQTISSFDEPFGDGWPIPSMASAEDLERTIDAYVTATRRALRAGFDTLEVHAAHGYLLHSFLSPLTNKRTDDYGGDLEARMGFPLALIQAVRQAWPKDKPLSVRVSSSDWDPEGWGMEDSVEFVRRLGALGVDYVCMSSGAIKVDTKVQVAPGYQTGFAAQVKKETDVPVSAVGLIATAYEADRVIAEGDADLVTVGRAFLDNPHWAWKAAGRLGAQVARPRQYIRTSPGQWPAVLKPYLKPAE